MTYAINYIPFGCDSGEDRCPALLRAVQLQDRPHYGSKSRGVTQCHSMSKSSNSRRDFLATGAAGVATGLALTAGAASGAASSAPSACGGLTREHFLQYTTLFNHNDPRFVEFYHDDVVLELGSREVRTPQGIREFYADVKAHLREKVEVTHFVSDATGIAVEMPTEFRVIKDWENGFFGRPLKVGEVMRIVSFVIYWVDNGKFRRIKSARYKLVNDWQMEA